MKVTPSRRLLAPPPLGKVAALVIVAVALVAAFESWVWWASRPQPVMVRIPKGATCSEVGRLLADRGVVSSALAFRVAALVSGLEGRVRWGVYRLAPGLGAFAVARQLAQGKVEHARVCIPEGFTCRQIADALQARGVCDGKAFLGKVRDPVFARKVMEDSGVPVPSGDSLRGLEGFLFPDTYDFPVAGEEAFVASVMVRRFRQEVLGSRPAGRVGQGEPDGQDGRIGQDGDALYRSVILASLVEREARLDSERELVAAVFANRLSRGMPLQSCATVQYALGHTEERLTYEDLAVESPYNTYLHRGYPPGPICSPGLRSLAAAARPARVSYLYFRLNPDGSHTFSTTFAAHQRAGRRR